MIDFFKAKLTDREKMKNNVTSNFGKFKSEANYNYSQDSITYPLRARIDNLLVKITEKGGTIENSLHKYFNQIMGDGQQNYNNFNFSDILCALSLLEDESKYPLERTVLTNLEFGFNIELEIDPSKFINNYVLMHNYKTPCYDPKNDVNKKIKKFIYTEYELKIYNKTLDQSRFAEFQKHLTGTRILRIEVKYKSKKQLNKLGIYNICDLKKPKVYRELLKDFMSKYKNLLIVDSYDGNSMMTKKERQFMKDCTNPNYWIKLKEEKHSNTITNHRKRLEKLIKKYELDSWKKNLEKDILKKFDELLVDDPLGYYF